MREISEGKIIVTGGAGFIGSSIIAELNNQGFENILVVDYLGEDEKFKNLIPLKFTDYIEADDFLDMLTYDDEILDEVTFVFHLGACSSTTEKNAQYLIKNNYEYTKKIALWAIESGARFVYASSAATYGDGAEGMDDKDENLHRLRPLNMYGYSKHLFDLYAQKTGILNKIVGLKYFNVFGPNEQHKGDMRSVVHKAFEQINETGKAKLFRSYHPDYKDGEQMRDFLYVKDAAKMTLHLAKNYNINGLVNLGSGQANTWLTLVQSIFDALNKPKEIEFIEMPDYLKPRYQYYTEANISKLLASNYKEAITPLSIAVQDYVKNYLLTGKYLGDLIQEKKN